MISAPIVGDGVIPEAAAFYEVRDAMRFTEPVFLFAQMASIIGVELRDVALYNMEPLHDTCRSFSIGYFKTLERCRVIDYSRHNVEYLGGKGIEAFHMPYGYHAALERPEASARVDKDIDVLFIGSVNQRRVGIFERLAKAVHFVWARGVYGVERDRLVARAKVHVNVHYSDVHPLEVVRLNYLMANHANIVSEPGDDPEVNAAYAAGLRFAETADLVEACIESLSNPIDGAECLKAMPQDCGPAQAWLDR